MKIRVGVLFGGMSVEHEVSVISGLQAYHAIPRDKYEPVPIYITKNGQWYTGEAVGSMDEYKDIPGLLKKSANVTLQTNENGAHQLIATKTSWFKKPVVGEIDVAFPVTHGTFGEDGALQGILEFQKVPYVGCDVLSSALGMDKVVMKAVVRSAGLPVVDFATFYSHQWSEDPEGCIRDAEAQLKYPVIVKPANLGSSVGIETASDTEQLKSALSNAFTFADKVIVERLVRNLKEVNCSVIGDHESVETSVTEEVLKTSEILSYQDKYMNQASKGMSGTSRIIPADISPELTKEVESLAKRTFLELGCNGVSRIDFLIDQDEGKVYVNEINTIPGSLAFYLWEPKGKRFDQMTAQLIQLALKRHRTKSQLTFSYDTNLLALQGKGGGSKKLGGR